MRRNPTGGDGYQDKGAGRCELEGGGSKGVLMVTEVRRSGRPVKIVDCISPQPNDSVGLCSRDASLVVVPRRLAGGMFGGTVCVTVYC